MKIKYNEENHEFFKPFIEEIENEVKLILSNDSNFPQVTYADIFAFKESGSRKESETSYFRRRRSVVALGLYLQWKNNEQAMRVFKNMVWDVCQEYSWALPAHYPNDFSGFTIDLFTAETAHMLSEFLQIFDSEFEPLLKFEICRQINQRIINPFLSQAWEWEKLENNWSAVCAGSIGMTVLNLNLDKDIKSIILDRVLKAMNYFKKGFASDGCCTEGISYWVYGFWFYLYFADVYQKKYGISLLDEDDELVEKIAAFPSKIEWSNQKYITFSDSVKDTIIPSSIRSFLNHNFEVINYENAEITSFHFDHCYRWAHLSRILWWSERNSVIDEMNIACHYFPDAQWMTFKGKNLFFAAKGGNNSESHNHNDLGSFILGTSNKLTFIDLGAGAYSADYFGEKRYEFHHTRSDWHNTLTINSVEQSQGDHFFATVEEAKITDDGCKLTLDLSGAYMIPDTKIKRTFELDDQKAELKIIDEVDCSSYQANFISYEKPKIELGNIFYQQFILAFDLELFETKIEETVITNHLNENETVYAFRLKNKKEHNIYTFIISCNSVN